MTSATRSIVAIFTSLFFAAGAWLGFRAGNTPLAISGAALTLITLLAFAATRRLSPPQPHTAAPALTLVILLGSLAVLAIAFFIASATFK